MRVFWYGFLTVAAFCFLYWANPTLSDEAILALFMKILGGLGLVWAFVTTLTGLVKTLIGIPTD